MLISAIFTIPAKFIPIIEARGDWYVLMIISVIGTLAVWYFLKRKNWI
jgi:hypothetical protein